MADFAGAVSFLLANEGGHFEDAATGEISNYGISLKWLKTIDPEATAATIRHLTRPAAVELYRKYWWDQFNFGLIPNAAVATKVFDAAVNCGAMTAIRILQETLNEPMESSEQIATDGHIGAKTAAAVERDIDADEYGLLAAFSVNLEDHYRCVAEKNPKLAHYLPAWLERAEKLPVLV